MDFPSATTGFLAAEEVSFRQDFLDLDDFLLKFYEYFAYRGILTIVLKELCAVITLGFTIFLSIYLFEFVDWKAVIDCHDEESCRIISEQIENNPFHHTPNFYSMLTALYFLLFLTYWLWRFWSSVKTISAALRMQSIYRDKLQITEKQLNDLQWHEVIERFIMVHKVGTFRIIPNKETIVVQDIILRILRRDNYLIALINKNRLNLLLPWWIVPFSTDNLVFTRSMEWALSFCLLDTLFTPQYTLNSTFLEDVPSLQYRFIMLGMIWILLLPFILVFIVFQFFLTNAQQFHSSKLYLGPRQWTPLARWQFREFNELPHTFEERMNRAVGPALDFLSCFHNSIIVTLAETGCFLSGSVLAVLIVVSLVSEGGLLYIHFWGYNLLWFLGITSAIFAACRSLLPTDAMKQKNETAEVFLHRMCAHTHSYPDAWQGHEKSTFVAEEVDFLLQHQMKIFLLELSGVFLTPFILCFSLPKSVPQLVEFLSEHSRFIPGLGVVCDYSLFEFAKYGDCSYCSPETQHNTQNAQNMTQKNPDLQGLKSRKRESEVLNFGKLEKSFLNFKQTYPNMDSHQLQLVPLSQDETVATSGFINRFGMFKEIKREEQLQGLKGLKSILETSELELMPHHHLDNNNKSLLVSLPNTADDSPEEKQQSSEQQQACQDQQRQQQDENMIKSTYLHPPPHLSRPPQFPMQMQHSQSSQLDFNATSASELPQILLSVLREQNIDYQNDFYWLARFHAEKQRQPRELEQSMLLFRERSMMRSSSVPQRQASPGGVYYPSVTQPRYDLDMKMISPESPGGLGLHLSGQSPGHGLGGGLGQGLGQQINNGFVPPPWSPPSSTQRYRPPAAPQGQQGQVQPRRRNDGL